jgi:hypothetical protein
MTGMVERAIEAVQTPEVQEMIKALHKHGLGVFMPHIHTDNGFEPLPRDKVQLEGDLKVSFVGSYDPNLAGASPVGWVWDEQEVRVATACYCTGAAHSPHWDRPPDIS